MDKLYEELFRAMNQFRKLKFAEMFPMINRTDFFVMCTIMDKGENGKYHFGTCIQSENASIRDFQNFKRVRGAWIRGAECQQK